LNRVVEPESPPPGEIQLQAGDLPAAVGAGDWVLKNLPKNYGEGYFYYALYYTSQGMFQLGGNYWDTYALNLYNMMIKFQQPDGSWHVKTRAAGFQPYFQSGFPHDHDNGFRKAARSGR